MLFGGNPAVLPPSLMALFNFCLMRTKKPKKPNPMIFVSLIYGHFDILMFQNGPAKIKPSKMEVAPQGCLQITNKKTTNQIN